MATPTVIVYTSNLCLLRDTLASKLDGNITRLQDIRETLALSEGVAVEGQEMHGLTGATIVVPDDHTLAEDGVLGVKVGAEGVVINTPVMVDSGLVTGDRGGGQISGEFGVAGGGVADVARFPG